MKNDAQKHVMRVVVLCVDQPVPVTLDPVDGLAPLKDDIHQRLTQMVRDHKVIRRFCSFD